MMTKRDFNSGLQYISERQFTKAKIFFESELKSNPNIDNYYHYYTAISRLGELLNKLVKYHHKIAKYTHYGLKSIEHKDSHLHSTQSVSYELLAIQKLFEKAKKTIKSKPPAGILEGIIFVTKLLEINKSSNRDLEFKKSLIEFQIIYTTKINLTRAIDEFSKEVILQLFIPKSIKKINEILERKNSDVLYLNPEQVNKLYKEHQHYQYTLKDHEIFSLLEQNIILFNHSFNNSKKYLDIWKQKTFEMTFNKVLLIHLIYDDEKFENLRDIIRALISNKLLDHSLAFLQSIIDAQSLWTNITRIADIILINQINKKNELLKNLLRFAFANIPTPANCPNDKFFNYLTYFHEYIESENEIDIQFINCNMQLLHYLIDIGNILINQIFDLAQEIEVIIGKENFIILIKKIITLKLSQENILVLFNYSLQLSKDSIHNLFALIDKYKDDFASIKDEIHDVIMKEFQLKFPERPIEEVIHDFQTKSNEVEYPVLATELKEIESKYFRIKSLGEKLLIEGRLGIQRELKSVLLTLDHDKKNEDAELMLIAIIRLQIKETLHINPYNIQMLNLLALVNQPRRIAQIKTGEGKSTLIAMLAAFYVLKQHVVDIITTSDTLAIRDAKKFKSFFESLGISVSHSINQENSQFFDNNIVYGTISDFEFAYLRGETQGEWDGRRKRPYDVAVVDEVDSMFIDMQRNQAILSKNNDEEFPKEVYGMIWNWVSKTEKIDQNQENLQAELKSQGIEINALLAKTWLKSALTAQIFSENKEYIIDNNETKSNKSSTGPCIKIVDKLHTGQIASEMTRWQGGLHQILEAKHHLPIKNESLTTGSISHIEYFNKYKILTGVTGTLGSESSRNELQQLYKINTYDSPSYKPSLKNQIPHIIEKDEEAQLIAVNKQIQQMNAAKRPTLILCEDIEKSKIFNQFLLKNNNKSLQLYNGVQALSAEIILSLAGSPGVATIATNCAGRGSDIITTREAEAGGGLHVIMTFPAINLRVEKQAFGRTGRQGKKGTFHYILYEGQLSRAENEEKTIEDKISLMHTHREKREKFISSENIFYHNLMHKLFILQNIFFSLPMNIKEDNMLVWAKFKTDASADATRFMRYELDHNDDDVVILHILDKFNEWWKNYISRLGNCYKTPAFFIETELKKLLQNHEDHYMKKLFLETLIFLENPKFVFSGELAQIFIEMKGDEIIESLKAPAKQTPVSFHSFMQFKLPEFISKILPSGDKKALPM